MIQSVSNQNPSLNNGNPNSNYMHVGPYRLEKTLGKGQTGKSETPKSYYSADFS